MITPPEYTCATRRLHRWIFITLDQEVNAIKYIHTRHFNYFIHLS